MNLDEYVDYWRNNLTKWSIESFAKYTVSSQTKSFLVNTGLPQNVDWTFKLGENYTKQLINSYNFIVLGCDGNMPVCVDTGNNECIIIFEEDNNRMRFANERIELWGFFLTYYQQYRLLAREVNEDQIMSYIDLVESKMFNTDFKAMDNKCNYWPIVVEQMRDGLL